MSREIRRHLRLRHLADTHGHPGHYPEEVPESAHFPVCRVLPASVRISDEAGVPVIGMAARAGGVRVPRVPAAWDGLGI